MNKIVKVSEEKLFKCVQLSGDDLIAYCQDYNGVSGVDIALLVIASIVIGAVMNDFFLK